MPTYRRADQLRRALDALAALDRPDGGFEVVVVDDGSPPADGVAAVLEDAATTFPVPLQWTSLDRNAGPAVARNRAWRMAAGEWIAFTDDDCRPRPDWLVRLLAAADAGVGADVVQGRTQPDPEGADRLDEPYARSMRVDALDGYYQTCNILYRRSLLEKAGGFDEQFRLIGDDTELGWRAAALGATETFAEDAVVHHDVVVRDWRWEIRSRRRWADAVRVVRLQPGARRLAWKPYVYRREHASVLALLVTAPVLVFRPGRRLWLAGLASVVARDVVRGGSPAGASAALVRRAGDAYETALMLARSVQERTVLL